MELKSSISSFLIKILAYSLLLATLAYVTIHFEVTTLSLKTVLSIQAFVLIVTVLVHLFLMRSASADERIQKFMFNFMLTTTLKIFIYCGAFVFLIFVGKNFIHEQYSNLSLFLVLFGYYLFYTIFEVASIMKFVRQIG